MEWIYLDNNATTQPAREVLAAMEEMNQTLWANPSSVHRLGQMVRQRVEAARASVAELLNAKDREIVFTSGGTESNNLALRGGLDNLPGQCKRLLTTCIEHAAIREPAEFLARAGTSVEYMKVDEQGRVDPATLAAALDGHGDSTLVSIQWANNETGVIQDIATLGKAVEEHRRRCGREGLPGRTLFHVDATQAVGKAVVDVRETGLDLLTLSGHKFHGPKGVGALYIRSGVRLKAQNLGGPQERERRGGTENTPGIVGLGVAAELARNFLNESGSVAALTQMRDRFQNGLLQELPGTVVNSGGARRLWNTANLGFVRLAAEAILVGLSERGLCASAGAACSSGSLEPSPVLLAMGVAEPVAHGSVRFSLSRFTTEKEIDAALHLIPLVIRKLAQTMPGGS